MPILRYSPYGYVAGQHVNGGSSGLGGIISPILGGSRLVAEYMPENLSASLWTDVAGVYDIAAQGTPTYHASGGPNGTAYTTILNSSNRYVTTFPVGTHPSPSAIHSCIIVIKQVTLATGAIIRSQGNGGSDYRALDRSGSTTIRATIQDPGVGVSSAIGTTNNTNWVSYVMHVRPTGATYVSLHDGVTHTFSTDSAARNPPYSTSWQPYLGHNCNVDLAYVGFASGELTGADLTALSPEFVTQFGIALV